MDTHFNTDREIPGIPHHRFELENMSVEDLYDFFEYCGVDPADPDVCLACAAYMLAQEKEEAVKKISIIADGALSVIEMLLQDEHPSFDVKKNEWRWYSEDEDGISRYPGRLLTEKEVEVMDKVCRVNDVGDSKLVRFALGNL